MNKLTLFLGVLFLLNSCTNGEQEDTNASEQTDNNTTVVILPKKPEKTKLIANIDYLRLRAEPGPSGETVAMLQEGDIMYDLGEVSDFSTRVELRGIVYNEPWLKVETSEGQVGWVFGGGVYFDANNASTTVEKLTQKRLESFFGVELTKEMQQHTKNFEAAASDVEMAKVLAEGEVLVEKVNMELEKKLPEPRDVLQKTPDLRWLERAIEEYHLGSAAEGTTFYFFRDFKKILPKVKQTKGYADDAFVDLNLALYAQDSIEYFYPSYFMQTWDYGGYSLLGEGRHKDILGKSNELMAKFPGVFDKEVEVIKDNLIHDMTATPEGYWYEKTKILKEFDEILAAEFGLLTDKDNIALTEQRKRLENPEENSINVGFRSGVGN